MRFMPKKDGYVISPSYTGRVHGCQAEAKGKWDGCRLRREGLCLKPTMSVLHSQVVDHQQELSQKAEGGKG